MSRLGDINEDHGRRQSSSKLGLFFFLCNVCFGNWDPRLTPISLIVRYVCRNICVMSI